VLCAHQKRFRKFKDSFDVTGRALQLRLFISIFPVVRNPTQHGVHRYAAGCTRSFTGARSLRFGQLSAAATAIFVDGHILEIEFHSDNVCDEGVDFESCFLFMEFLEMEKRVPVKKIQSNIH
jgi:hypothetical protein